jgi:tetratricopeptide (TPR) repeat protein/predicted Ser/Thr protein kinase
VKFLGQGGMGRVFLAHDPRLRRQVALKFVRDDHPELAHRFLSEARAQAKVNHERVCKVYEVGQVGRKVFIAMQYVEGQPLGSLVRELTVEQKALVLRDAALGVHEAHRAGLIHRDLKPSNIMVERGEDGVPRPYVMDFGLARDWNEGVTVTGTVLGTPHYMAPEQARGEVARLDRRADVYSLGATLYALLTGQPPIQGGNGLEVLNNLATQEPRPPRTLDRDIPPDLEAITLKCLEKERSARYDSARALAEDLDRFLAGEPVLARTGPGYRLRKRLRKHRLLVSAVTAALLAVAVAVGWSVMTRRETAERERLASRFTELVERIESMARYSALSRLHDVREDRRVIQVRMAELEAEIRQAGERALGPGHYALGRGAFALGDTEKAREHLESAWRHGFDEPRAAYALALVMGQLYQQQRLEAERIPSTELRESKLRDIERRYRDPALGYLKQSKDAEVPSAEYVEALIAFYEGRFDEALARLDAMSGRLPWFYEAPKLRGDILVARTYKRWREGDVDGAKADLESGRKAYAAAAATAESVPAVHQALAQLEGAEMLMQLYGPGDVLPSYTRSHDALMRGLAVAPDDARCWLVLARLHLRLAEARSLLVRDVEGTTAKAIEAAERALALSPAHQGEARMALARGFGTLGSHILNRGGNPLESFRKAVELFESVRQEDRSPEFHSDFGVVLKRWADYEERIGDNSLGRLDRAIQEYQAALALSDRVPETWINLGSAFFVRASNRHNSEPERDVAQGMSALDKARSLNPKHYVTYFYLGQLHELRARRLRNRGGDPMPDLMSALERYQQGLTINPKSSNMHNGTGVALLEQAQERWMRGGDPFPLLDQARTAFEQAMNAAPTEGYAHNNLGILLAQRARYLRSRGRDPRPSVREAEELVKQGLERMPGLAHFSVILGSVHVIRAGYDLDRGSNPGQDLARAEEKLRHVLAQNPDNAEAWLQLGEAQALRAGWRARSGRGRAEDFEEAAKSYEKALALAPDELEYPLRLARFCHTWAAWQKQAGGEHARVLKRGLALVDQTLKVRPDWAEAQALRASLLQASR